jgi:hypothetical protein
MKYKVVLSQNFSGHIYDYPLFEIHNKIYPRFFSGGPPLSLGLKVSRRMVILSKSTYNEACDSFKISLY